MAKLIIIMAILCNFHIASTRVMKSNQNLAMGNEGADMIGIDFDDRSAAIAYSYRFWPNGRVYYVLAKSLEMFRSHITKAMAEYTEKTQGCITFEEGEGNGDFVSMNRLQGCSSQIGIQGGKQFLSLGVGCINHGIILHELGHVLGLYHEQNRSDRDKYVKIHFENIAQGYKVQFKKITGSGNYLFSKYDYGSIMQYDTKAFSGNGQDTIEPLYPYKVLGQRIGLSAGDVIAVMNMYSCPDSNKPSISIQTENERSVKCEFGSGFCIFHNISPNATFKRVGTGRNGYLTSNSALLDHRLLSAPLEIPAHGKIRVNYIVRCRGHLEICECGVRGFNSSSFSLLKYQDWVGVTEYVENEASESGAFKIYFDARPADEESSMDLKSFSYHYVD